MWTDLETPLPDVMRQKRSVDWNFKCRRKGAAQGDELLRECHVRLRGLAVLRCGESSKSCLDSNEMSVQVIKHKNLLLSQ